MAATASAPATLLGRAPAEFGALMPLFFEYFEKGDAVAEELMALELGYIDNYVKWFKARGVGKMAAVGGFGTRLYPLLIAPRAPSRGGHSGKAELRRMNYLDRSNPSVSSRIIPVQPFDYVVFGATGDLLALAAVNDDGHDCRQGIALFLQEERIGQRREYRKRGDE
eukprot:gene1127-1478_t